MSKKERDPYVSEMITEAALNLLKEGNWNSSSITELCEQAHVSRVSFYRNFSSKEDIIRQYLSGITDVFLGKTSVNFRTTQKKDFIVYLIKHMQKHREIISLLIENGLPYLIKEEFDEAFTRSIPIYHDPYRCYVASGAYFNLIYYWFLNGCKETAQQLAEMDLGI